MAIHDYEKMYDYQCKNFINKPYINEEKEVIIPKEQDSISLCMDKPETAWIVTAHRIADYRRTISDMTILPDVNTPFSKFLESRRCLV